MVRRILGELKQTDDPVAYGQRVDEIRTLGRSAAHGLSWNTVSAIWVFERIASDVYCFNKGLEESGAPQEKFIPFGDEWESYQRVRAFTIGHDDIERILSELPGIDNPRIYEKRIARVREITGYVLDSFDWCANPNVPAMRFDKIAAAVSDYNRGLEKSGAPPYMLISFDEELARYQAAKSRPSEKAALLL